MAAFTRGPSAPGGDAAIVALRRHFEEIRQQVLAETGTADADAVTRLLVNRLLHTPSAALRALAAECKGRWRIAGIPLPSVRPHAG